MFENIFFIIIIVIYTQNEIFISIIKKVRGKIQFKSII